MLINRDNTCCFTGHRPNKLPWSKNEDDPRCIALKSKIYDIASALYFSGIRHYICGMALGCDMYFAEEVLRLREEHPDITIEAAIPCVNQTEFWSEETKRRYNRIVSECDYETLIQNEYTDDCMKKRNRYMVDNSSVLIAVFDGTIGGTYQTVNYAAKKGLEIIRIAPEQAEE